MPTTPEVPAWMRSGRYDIRIRWEDRSLLNKLAEDMNCARPQVIFRLLREEAERRGIQPDVSPNDVV
jgi:hypothetical protein